MPLLLQPCLPGAPTRFEQKLVEFPESQEFGKRLEDGFRVPEEESKLERWITEPGSKISRVCLPVATCVERNHILEGSGCKVWVQASAPKIVRNETKNFMGWKQPGVLETSFLDFLLSDVLSTAVKSNKTVVFIPWE